MLQSTPWPAPSPVALSASASTATRRGTPDAPAKLALDGIAVRTIIGSDGGPRVGEALRWLQEQVAANPQLNTAEALTALLRFRPTPSWRLGAADSRGAGGPSTSRAGPTPEDHRPDQRPGEDGTPARIVVDGEIDLANAQELAAAVGRARRAAAGTLDVDLRRLDFIDAAGMRALVRAAKMGPGADVRVLLASGSIPHRVAELLGLNAHLPLSLVERTAGR